MERGQDILLGRGQVEAEKIGRKRVDVKGRKNIQKVENKVIFVLALFYIFV